MRRALLDAGIAPPTSIPIGNNLNLFFGFISIHHFFD